MTKILIDEATVKLALEALEYIEHNYMSLPAPAEKAITALREALTSVPDWASEAIEQPAQQEPVALKWQQAPIRTAWGDDMVVASVAIDNDHTLSLYCERDQAPKVDAMFAQRKPLTDEEIIKCWGQVSGTRYGYVAFARAIEAAHGITAATQLKENT